jgi:hypothetical protein
MSEDGLIARLLVLQREDLRLHWTASRGFGSDPQLDSYPERMHGSVFPDQQKRELHVDNWCKIEGLLLSLTLMQEVPTCTRL